MAETIKNFIESKLGVSPDNIAKAEEYANAENCSLNFALDKLNLVSKEDLLNGFAKFYGVRKTILESMDIHPSIISLIPKKMAEEHRIIPLDRAGNNIILAMANPKDLKAIDAIRFQTGYFAKPVFANESDIRLALRSYYSHKQVSVDHIDSDKKGKPGSTKDRITIKEGNGAGDDGPVIKLVNDILLQCISRGASDIHLEPYEEYMRVRLRIDGVLHEIVRPPQSVKPALISRIKIMSNMDIAETRLPQDGAINLNAGGKDIDFRVNTLPAMYGEKIVLRILDKMEWFLLQVQLVPVKRRLFILHYKN
jgi:type IV pilus assembly protein PilB